MALYVPYVTSRRPGVICTQILRKKILIIILRTKISSFMCKVPSQKMSCSVELKYTQTLLLK